MHDTWCAVIFYWHLSIGINRYAVLHMRLARQRKSPYGLKLWDTPYLGNKKNNLLLIKSAQNFEDMLLMLQKYYLNFFRFFKKIVGNFLNPHLYINFLSFDIWKRNFLKMELREILRRRLSFIDYNLCQFSDVKTKWKGNIKVEF